MTSLTSSVPRCFCSVTPKFSSLKHVSHGGECLKFITASFTLFTPFTQRWPWKDWRFISAGKKTFIYDHLLTRCPPCCFPEFPGLRPRPIDISLFKMAGFLHLAGHFLTTKSSIFNSTKNNVVCFEERPGSNIVLQLTWFGTDEVRGLHRA